MEAVVGAGPSPSFWQARRVFLTGHTGFKGTWLATWLSAMGATVQGYALAPTSDSLYRDVEPIARAASFIGDIRDPDALAGSMTGFRPDVVFHLAAQPLVLDSYERPRETHETNVMGTVNLLEAVRQCSSVRSVVVVTTDKCYENREWCWPYRESDSLGGHDPYSASKAAAELVVASYRSSFFDPDRYGTSHRTAVASARAGNVIGGGDRAANRLLPDLVRAARAGRPAVIRNPDAVRPWQHVLEPTSGYLVLAERLFESAEFADCWNFGPREDGCRSVRWVCEEVARHLPSLALEFGRSDGPHEAGLLKLDISKAIARLGWRPRWTIAEAIRRTIRTYLDLYRPEAQGPGLLNGCINQYAEVRSPDAG